ncbi:hypothetical protein FH972_021771 [Carpinus fangiana]|uniref:HSF-type DNA-binding domain-containing protein n=1 Tax=Carpinus fangiana TaxID=176857 RepID=A0A5N6KQM9_9ROSI|nr:hypothetical protein FH972_021771 [Carpinus fangiana]
MSTDAQDDPMDTSPAKSDMGPPPTVAGANGNKSTPTSPPPKEAPKEGEEDTQAGATQQASAGAAAAASNQPKVHARGSEHTASYLMVKLERELPDLPLQRLLQSPSVCHPHGIIPAAVLTPTRSYFKHTNVSSFVRQLNMYGFHKVHDVFHSGSPDSPLWEFKHGNGSFKRGDLAGLREIKRRASRHTLIHRDSFSSAPKSVVAPQVVATAEVLPETVEQRVSMLQLSLSDMHARLIRSEEAQSIASARCQSLGEHLAKSLSYTSDLSGIVLNLVQDPNHQAHRDASIIQQDIASSIAQLQNDPLLNSYQAPGTESGQVSPRQLAQDDPRRGSLREAPRSSFFRPLAPSPRPFATASGGTSSPSNSRPYLPQIQPGSVVQPSHQHPLSSATLSSSYLSRRHTSADIRADGWHPGQHLPSSLHLAPASGSGAHSAQYPSSPSRGVPPQPAIAQGEQRLRESLANYQMGSGMSARRGTAGYPPQHDSRPSTPPSQVQHPANGGPGTESGWSSMPGARIPFKDVFRNTGVNEHGHSNPSSSPATRRSSLANIHTILNPADTAERNGEDEDTGPTGEDWRKRKRLIKGTADQEASDCLPHARKVPAPRRSPPNPVTFFPGSLPGLVESKHDCTGTAYPRAHTFHSEQVIALSTATMVEKVYVTYNDVHKLCQTSAPKILDSFNPSLMIAIGGGGYVPARILRSFLKRPGGPNIPIQAIGLSLYEQLPAAAGAAVQESQIEQPGTRVTRTQWLDLSSLEMANLIGKDVLIVDEVDDTRTTLEYAVRELEKDVEQARQLAGRTGAQDRTRFSVFVLHNKDKEKRGSLPRDMVEGVEEADGGARKPRYLAAQTVGDVWICYPWEATDIDEHDRLAGEQAVVPL